MFSWTELFCLLCTWLASGGLINGWGPLHSVLEQTTTVDENDLQLMVDLAGISLSVASVLFGVMIDHAGARCAFITGLLVAAVGNLCLALSSAPYVLILGFSLIAGGGIGPYLGAMAIARAHVKPARLISINAAMFNL
jgi:predicted MFS family arabinose efflux permease